MLSVVAEPKIVVIIIIIITIIIITISFYVVKSVLNSLLFARETKVSLLSPSFCSALGALDQPTAALQGTPASPRRRMPCAACGCWVEGSHRMIMLQPRLNEVAATSLSGEVLFVLELLPGTEHGYLRREVATALGVEVYRVILHFSFTEEIMVQVLGEWLRWRQCEMYPPPEYLKHVTYGSVRNAHGVFFFYCESCRREQVHLDGYENINCEGNASTASESDQI